MKKVLFTCVVFLMVLGCGETDPILSDASITDESPVVGQRISALVYLVTDNPPMTYEWTATAGTIETPENVPYSTYWTAPETPGSQSITCTAIDSKKNRTSHTFYVQVGPKSLTRDLVEAGREVITITKQTDSMIGGIWASIRDDKIRFISSKFNEETIWARNFFTMLGRTSAYSGDYTLWGVEKTGNVLSALTTTSETLLTCGTCFNYDIITSLAIDVLDSDIIWIGTTSSLCYYDQSSNIWGRYLYGQVNGLSEGPDYVYAATNDGVYRLDGKVNTLYSGDTCAVLAVSNGTSTDVWSIVQGTVRKNGQQISPQPPSTACSLDQDIAGNIWCGKYRYNGSQWVAVDGLESVAIVRSVASTDGRIYFLSDSGMLYRW